MDNIITINNLSFKYSESIDFELKNIEMTITPGKLTFWTGRNGTGKSTLAKILCNEIKCITGEINPNKLVTSFHYQSLSSNVFSELKVKDHFKLLKSNKHNIDKLKNRFSKLNDIWDKYPDELSGGERQLLAFTTAFCKDGYDLYIFDEVFNHLDHDVTKIVINYLIDKVRDYNVNCIIITHDLDLISNYADTLYVFNNKAIEGPFNKEYIKANTKRINEMSKYKVTDYFAMRAPRYQKALEGLPWARILDYIPYICILQHYFAMSKNNIRICDAFGGTGFLARGLKHNRMSYVVCDCCPEMLSGAESVITSPDSVFVTTDDFNSVIDRYGQNSFDLVFCHGGMHHVVDFNDNVVDIERSRLRQLDVTSRLAKLLKNNGYLIIADIPDVIPNEIYDSYDMAINRNFINELFGSIISNHIFKILATDNNKLSINNIHKYICENLVCNIRQPVPRYFFDEYISNTTLGHKACYPDFDLLHNRLINQDLLNPVFRLNYKGPWLFESIEDAGWFFREKFSIGTSSKKNEYPQEDRDVYKNKLNQYLGAHHLNNINMYAVNWGVTYAVYQKE